MNGLRRLWVAPAHVAELPGRSWASRESTDLGGGAGAFFCYDEVMALKRNLFVGSLLATLVYIALIPVLFAFGPTPGVVWAIIGLWGLPAIWIVTLRGGFVLRGAPS